MKGKEDFNVTVDYHLIDIEVHKNVTQLRIDAIDTNKVIDLVFSNNFIEKLGSLIVLIRMQAARKPGVEYPEHPKTPGLDNYYIHLDKRIRDLKKQIQDEYGKAFIEGI